ncbi:MAG TPA: hypothetical protein VGF67_29505 [Ktedonobacteraceae bacterium]
MGAPIAPAGPAAYERFSRDWRSMLPHWPAGWSPPEIILRPDPLEFPVRCTRDIGTC